MKFPDGPQMQANDMTQQHAPATRFQLLRLILIDSLSSGRIVEMALDGGAVLTGRNGRGKTSLLQLLLLFYGESPNRIVTTEAGRKSFTGYYLPHTTSYLVYEYQRYDGQKRLVVAYADRNGERVFFRFIRAGYALQQFIDVAGGILQAPDLAKHLRTNGYSCSEQIESLAEYRAIIQATHSGTRDRERQKQLRALIADYAFTHSNRPLTQIEKIVSGMFRRKTNFEDLQSMVVDCIAEQDSTLSLSGDRRKIESWPQHYQAYQSVMALAPTLDAADTAHQHLVAAEQALGEIRAQYRSLQEHLDATQQSIRSQYAQQKVQADQEYTAYEEKRIALVDQQRKARQEAEFAEKQANALAQQRDQYAQQSVEQKAALAEREADFKLEQTNLQQRRTALLGKQSEIDATYKQLKDALKEHFDSQREDIQQQRETLTKTCEADLLALENHFNQQEQQFANHQAAERLPLQQAVETANTNVGACQRDAKHPQPNPAIAQHLQEKRQQQDKRQQEKDLQEQQLTKLDTAYRQAKQAVDDQERQVSMAKQVLEQANKELADTKRFHQPETGTLLHFLRQEHPEWTRDIAKVIRPDIFTRTDLSPSLLDSIPSLYGLALDLDKLDAHRLADPQAALQAIAQAEAQCQAAKTTLETKHTLWEKLNKAREAADAACQTQRQTVLQAKTHLEQAKAEVAEANRQLEHSRHHAKAQADLALHAAQATLQQHRQTLNQFDNEIRAATLQRQADYQSRRKTRQAQRDTQLQALKIRLDMAEQELKTKQREYDNERNAALRNEGVDTDKLQVLENDLKQVTQTLAAIRRDADLINAWKHWLKHDWVQYETYTQTAAQHRNHENTHTQALTEHQRQWTKRQHELKTELERLGKQVGVLEDQCKTVRQQWESLQQYPDNPTPDYDPTWTLDTLTLRANQQRDIETQQGKELKRHITSLQRGFNTASGTPPEQFLSTHQRDLLPYAWREWLPVFKEWFTTAHTDTQRLLLVDARAIASGILKFHQDMEAFHLKVLQFNRELQANLDNNTVFDSISKVHVEVISTIKELQYWPAICDMVETNRPWMMGLNQELPPVEFAQTIGRLLEHWEVKSGIRADLKHLLRLQGEVTENGNRRTFHRASDLEAVSSNGLSYLVLVIIFVAFINRIRRHAQVNIVWALDELKDLDSGNIPALLELLARNNITLVSAFPDPDPETLALFKHRFTVEPDRRLAEVRIGTGDEPTDTEVLPHV
ncbi:MAG TPA: ATP-binding protein [Candidatus Thiothrix moscowensis]|uniref:ATP-binding protein n=2 Tax=Thiothrix TaxID=1030 RepID=UPI0025CE3639|nr:MULTISPECIES: ATP-binding protein [unclassified Thiothrix]HRJ54614.1 ATP-binding protein [Candidatus Thiothrix moscowensis]HRJ94994.1 ATP-binding protein [Candidatus Thiothrix moscowensis]